MTCAKNFPFSLLNMENSQPCLKFIVVNFFPFCDRCKKIFDLDRNNFVISFPQNDFEMKCSVSVCSSEENSRIFSIGINYSKKILELM